LGGPFYTNILLREKKTSKVNIKVTKKYTPHLYEFKMLGEGDTREGATYRLYNGSRMMGETIELIEIENTREELGGHEKIHKTN
jgi:hypothetical protein